MIRYMPDYLKFSSDKSGEELIEIKHHDGGLILKQENQICMCKKICIKFLFLSRSLERRRDENKNMYRNKVRQIKIGKHWNRVRHWLQMG